jgi:hypothetical protein
MTILYILTFLFINVQIYKMNIKHFSLVTILNLSMVKMFGVTLVWQTSCFYEFTLNIVSVSLCIPYKKSIIHFYHQNFELRKLSVQIILYKLYITISHNS